MYLIVNLGLKSIRGIIFNDCGEQIYTVSYPVHTYLLNERVEQSPSEWIFLLEKIMDDIKSQTSLAAKIRYITSTTSSSCFLGIDSNKKPATNVLMVSDKRSQNEVELIRNLDNYDERIQVNLSSLLPKAVWFKINESKIFNKVKYWIGAAEFLSYFFTGEIFVDPLNAGKSSYLDGSYPFDLFKELGIDERGFSSVLPVGTKMEVSGSLKKKYGLSNNCTYILTTYDAICAVIGSNTGDFANACDVSGTVTSVRVLNKEKLFTNNEMLLNQEIEFLNTYLVGASNNLGGGIIEWLKQSFFVDEGENPYHKMEKLAQESTEGANGLIFLPYMLGERAPFHAPNASGNYFGINRSSTLKDFTRSAFEATAFVTKDLLNLITESGKNVESLSVSGGLARFDLVNQIKADVCDLPVHVVQNFESTSLGAFIIASIASGKFNSLDQALRETIKIRKTIYPSSKNVNFYANYFKLYKDLNHALMPVYNIHRTIKNMEFKYGNEVVRNL